MKCQNCGKVTILYAPICPSCGYNIMKSNEEQNKNKISSLQDSTNISYCPNCGEKRIMGSNFCPYCGIDFKNKVITSNMKVADENKNAVNGVIQNENSDGLIWILVGFISAIIAIFLFPPAFGIFGVICGTFAIKKGRSFGGGFIILLSLICMIIGFVYGASVMMQKMSHY